MDILAALSQGLLVAVQPGNLAFAAIGVLLGTLVGILPGISPSLTVALLLPVTFKLDPTQKLKEMDATGGVLPAKKDRTFLGIYELDGDTLKWCVDNRRKERPTEFRTANGAYLLILKRRKK